MILDLARARRNAFFSLLSLNKIKHAPLPVGEHAGTILQTATDASSNEHSCSRGAVPRAMQRGPSTSLRSSQDDRTELQPHQIEKLAPKINRRRANRHSERSEESLVTANGRIVLVARANRQS